MENKKTYEYATRLAGHPNQYHILKVFLGDKLIAVHTSKSLAYLQKIQAEK
jgi:hypothetical protein